MADKVAITPELEVLSLDPLSSKVPDAEWRQLCETAVDPNPFFGAAFLRPFLENMRGGNIRLVTVRNRETGEWLMAAPVGTRRCGLLMPSRVTWATDYAPLGTPLLHPDAGMEVLSAFFKVAAGAQNLLAVPYLPLTSHVARRFLAVPGLVSKVTARAMRAGHDAGTAGKQQFEAAFSGKRRKEMRRLLRRLDDLGATRFESLYGQDAIAGFESFLKLEAAGWKGRAGTALSSDPRTEAFSRAAIGNLATLGAVRIDELWSGDVLTASLVLLQQGGQVFSWKIAFDESYARFSPGSQIVLHAFQQNLELSDFKGADSLAIPGHSMIEPLWRGRLETGTLLLAGGKLSAFLQQLSIADLTAERILRSLARTLKKRVKS